MYYCCKHQNRELSTTKQGGSNMDGEYEDPIVKYVGIAILFVVALALILLVVYYIFIFQVDNSRDYCYSVRRHMQVRDCKAVNA